LGLGRTSQHLADGLKKMPRLIWLAQVIVTFTQNKIGIGSFGIKIRRRFSGGRPQAEWVTSRPIEAAWGNFEVVLLSGLIHKARWYSSGISFVA